MRWAVTISGKRLHRPSCLAITDADLTSILWLDLAGARRGLAAKSERTRCGNCLPADPTLNIQS